MKGRSIFDLRSLANPSGRDGKNYMHQSSIEWRVLYSDQDHLDGGHEGRKHRVMITTSRLFWMPLRGKACGRLCMHVADIQTTKGQQIQIKALST